MTVEHKSRLTIILHPNPECIDIILSDKFFNKERFSFSRDKKPSGHEERMLNRLSNIFAITEARTSRNELSLRIQDGSYYEEFMPQVVEIVREFAGPDHAQVIYLDDRRESIPSRWDEDGYQTFRGKKIENADIGVPYLLYDRNDHTLVI